MTADREPKGVRLVVRGLFVLVPVGYGLLALALGMDASWDLRNYHYYGAYAFLSGRLGFDVLLAHPVPSFFNPTIDVPFFLAAEALPARSVGFLLGLVQGLNFWPLFGTAHAVLLVSDARRKLFAAAGLALLGMTGAGALSELGTTFYDNVVSLGPLCALWLVVRRYPTLLDGRVHVASRIVLVAGLAAGVAVGLKPVVAPLAAGLCLAFLFQPGARWRRVLHAASFGLGAGAGVLATAGHWMAYLWHSYGNPIFPLYNQIFLSPMALPEDYRQVFRVPDSLLARLFFPVAYTVDPYATAEVWFRDHRVLVSFFSVLAVAAVHLFWRRERPVARLSHPAATRYVLGAVSIAYVLWAVMFSVYRYLMPLEMLAPLVIVLAIGLFPLARPTRVAVAVGLLAFVALSVQPADWGRLAWTEKWVTVTLPALPRPDRTLVLMPGQEPLSFLVPAFPPAVRFVRIRGPETGPGGTGAWFRNMIREIIDRHDGDLYGLFIPVDAGTAGAQVALHGLSIDWGACQTVSSSIGPMPYDFCPLRRD